MAVEKFSYNADGTIPTLVQTSTGVNGEKKRLQSYNFQNMFVRHASFDVKIDANVSPANDQYWKIVPGLANGGSEYVSFQSVYYPGYYLRHSDYDFVLAKDDGTAAFKADATFKKVPGLKDAAWSSFQSYNFPARYIRHSGYLLKLDPLSTDQDKQDATFKIVN
ncbi:MULTISPECIES: AbfB domain-containing protein [Paenibacillus]|uniref:AbfB domain-containing protein n=1 Tax=Paenibacillus TaxID=44249 RepID=UPI0022B9218D|nr:AbfB domain-containing protein [Paenibacillus caseinilyticus]MCZ8520282.1 AbfB domain-containing protein [Paenibacillus caseinilyticus]